MIHSRLSAFAIASLLFSHLPLIEAASVTARIDAKVRSFGNVHADNSTFATLTAPDDIETRTVSESLIDGPTTNASGVAIFDGTNNSAIAMLGAANIIGDTVGPNRNGLGGGDYNTMDLITVSSTSLAIGTPTQVKFAFYLAYDAFVMHNKGAHTEDDSALRLNFDTEIFGQTTGNYERLRNTENRYNNSISGDFGGLIQLGLFNPLTPYTEIVFDTEVGEVIDFRMGLFVFAYAAAQASGLNMPSIGQSQGGTAVAFGASALDDAVSLSSELFPGAFPDASLATLSNANAALVPIPAVGYLFAGAVIFLLKIRRKREL